MFPLCRCRGQGAQVLGVSGVRCVCGVHQVLVLSPVSMICPAVLQCHFLVKKSSPQTKPSSPTHPPILTERPNRPISNLRFTLTDPQKTNVCPHIRLIYVTVKNVLKVREELDGVVARVDDLPRSTPVLFSRVPLSSKYGTYKTVSRANIAHIQSV